MSSTQSHSQQQYMIKTYTQALLRDMAALGFEQQAVGDKYNVTFGAQMFVKPNSKAFEVIVHFLLSQLDPERATRLFAQCWPPLCKETIKEFKDAIFSWLSELAPSVSASAASGSVKTTSTASVNTASGNKQLTSNSLMANPYHARLLQLIRFPPVTKSLLAVPCGLKACELLYALVTYVILSKSIRLSEYFLLFSYKNNNHFVFLMRIFF